MKSFRQFLVENLDSRVKTLERELSSKYGVNLFLSYNERQDSVKIHSIIVPKEDRKEGKGTEIMERIVEFADKHNLLVVLTAAKDYGSTSVSRLKKFYKRFGFKENKGRNKDFRFIETMIRKPK